MFTRWVSLPLDPSYGSRGSRPIHLSNSHAKSAAAFGRRRGGRRVSALARRALSPRKAEGRSADWRHLQCARLGGRARPFGEGTLRPSALRAAVYGLRGRASADRAFPALALSVAIITVANESREGRSAPGAIPVPPGAPCLRGTGARAPHPAPPSDASGDALE